MAEKLSEITGELSPFSPLSGSQLSFWGGDMAMNVEVQRRVQRVYQLTEQIRQAESDLKAIFGIPSDEVTSSEVPESSGQEVDPTTKRRGRPPKIKPDHDPRPKYLCNTCQAEYRSTRDPNIERDVTCPYCGSWNARPLKTSGPAEIQPAKVIHKCCGSKGPRHRGSCRGETQEDTEIKKFECDSCNKSFETNPELPGDIVCPHCQSGDVWPVKNAV